jgi:lipid-binding SYLF domain-containing protein
MLRRERRLVPAAAGFLALALVLALQPNPLRAQSDETARVENSLQVLKDILNLPEKGMPQWLLTKAEGLAIIPGVVKAAYVVGGEYGKGVVMIRRRGGRWSEPVFIKLTGGSVGWQIGIQRADIVLVFKNRVSVENIAKGKFTLGADAAVAAGPLGRNAQASTDLELKAEIYSYSRSKGLFAGISISGASLSIDHKADEAFYGSGGVRVRRIFQGRGLKVPPAAKTLRDFLNAHIR